MSIRKIAFFHLCPHFFIKDLFHSFIAFYSLKKNLNSLNISFIWKAFTFTKWWRKSNERKKLLARPNGTRYTCVNRNMRVYKEKWKSVKQNTIFSRFATDCKTGSKKWKKKKFTSLCYTKKNTHTWRVKKRRYWVYIRVYIVWSFEIRALRSGCCLGLLNTRVHTHYFFSFIFTPAVLFSDECWVAKISFRQYV